MLEIKNRGPYNQLLIISLISLTLLGGTIERIERELYGVKPGVHLEEMDISCYLPRELMPILEEMAARSQTFPIEPAFNKDGKIVSGADGSTLDVEATMDMVLAAPRGKRITPVYIKTPPGHNEKDLKGINQVIGRYATWDEGSQARKHNMNLACQTLNFSVVWPEETFSFNKVVGPPTEEYGYYAAPIMLDEEMVPGVGGGVCQVATTLYNAVKVAQLPVVERHVHSGKVYYVPEGLDAAIAYDYMDFKFKNNKRYPVVIKSYLGAHQIKVEILGK